MLTTLHGLATSGRNRRKIDYEETGSPTGAQQASEYLAGERPLLARVLADDDAPAPRRGPAECKTVGHHVDYPRLRVGPLAASFRRGRDSGGLM